MNQKHIMDSAEIERLLLAMSANNTLDVALTDAELDLLPMNAEVGTQAEQLTSRALLKMQEAQRKREPDFQPVGIDEQGRLDQKKPIVCPHCGQEFVPNE